MKNANSTMPSKKSATSPGMSSATTTSNQSKTDFTAKNQKIHRPKTAAQQTLYNVFYKILQLLAPITPHLTEEIYQNMYAQTKGFDSLQITPWPKMDNALVDMTAEEEGDKVMALIEDVRRKKACSKVAAEHSHTVP